MKSLAISVFITLLFSCGTKKNAVTEKNAATESEQKTKTGIIHAVAEIGKIPTKSDTLNIRDVTIRGNTLTMVVSYTGGCADHEFRLIGSQMISKSLPPIRYVKLIHNANGDACEVLTSKTLRFDITALAYQKEAGSEIMLNIDGTTENIKYTFE